MSEHELALAALKQRVDELYKHVVKSIIVNEGVWAMNALRDFEEALERAGGDLLLTLAVSVDYSRTFSAKGW